VSAAPLYDAGGERAIGGDIPTSSSFEKKFTTLILDDLANDVRGPQDPVLVFISERPERLSEIAGMIVKRSVSECRSDEDEVAGRALGALRNVDPARAFALADKLLEGEGVGCISRSYSAHIVASSTG